MLQDITVCRFRPSFSAQKMQQPGEPSGLTLTVRPEERRAAFLSAVSRHFPRALKSASMGAFHSASSFSDLRTFATASAIPS